MWSNERVLVTGGASFIGSHLVDTLIKKGAVVTLADDFSSGKMENLKYDLKESSSSTWSSGNLFVHRGDLKERAFTRSMMRDIGVVFHLAALHGGRGYIDTHPAECCTNMIIDQLVFEEACRAGVGRICFASSACVYPAYLQEETGSSYLLKEEDADPFVRDRAQADLEYGWAKLMGEMASASISQRAWNENRLRENLHGLWTKRKRDPRDHSSHCKSFRPDGPLRHLGDRGAGQELHVRAGYRGRSHLGSRENRGRLTSQRWKRRQNNHEPSG